MITLKNDGLMNQDMIYILYTPRLYVILSALIESVMSNTLDPYKYRTKFQIKTSRCGELYHTEGILCRNESYSLHDHISATINQNRQMCMK